MNALRAVWVVPQELLSPHELELVKELNDMDIPLSIAVEDEPPLSTSRRATEQALNALVSPGAAASAAEFSEVLKLFQSGGRRGLPAAYSTLILIHHSPHKHQSGQQKPGRAGAVWQGRTAVIHKEFMHSHE